MTVEFGTWPLYDEAIAPAARRVAPLLKQFGWDADDCAQQAAVWVIDHDPLKPAVMEMAAADRARYLAVAVRRYLVKAARYQRHEVYGKDDGALLDTLETRFGHHESLVAHADLLERAPEGDVRDWLHARAVAGLTFNEAMKGLGWSKDRAAKARTHAAAWLLAQYEGTPSEGDRG